MTAEWERTVTAPDDEAVALVHRATGWPDAAVGRSPLVWAEAVLSGIHAAVGDERWGIDLATLRLTEAAVDVRDVPAATGDVRVRAELVRVLDLGATRGVMLSVSAEVAGGDEVVAARATLSAQGRGLAGGARPDAPAGAPRAEGDPVWTGAVTAAHEPVVAFTRWSGDSTPFHVDPAAAAAAGLPGPIAPGMWVLGALAAAAAHVRSPVTAVAARFVRPTPLDATLRLAAHGPGADGRLAVAATGTDGPVVRRAWARAG